METRIAGEASYVVKLFCVCGGLGKVSAILHEHTCTWCLRAISNAKLYMRQTKLQFELI